MKEILKYPLWALYATIWSSLCFVLPDFLDNPILDFKTILTICAYLLAIGGASFGLLYLAGVNKYAACILIPLYGIAGAVVSFYRVAFHATVTPMIIDATLHTNSGTIAGVVSWQLIVWIVLNACIAAGFVWWRSKKITLSHPLLHALVAIVCVGVYYNAHWRLKSSINQRYPYNIYHSLCEYNKQRHEIAAERNTLPFNINQVPDSIDVIVVLGEAMRADHLNLNGYERETCPRLAQRKNIISFPNIYSEYTYTAMSVPHILTPADSLHPEWAGTYHSFIHTLDSIGFATSWLSNQDNGHTYAAFIGEADTVVFPNAGKSSYVYSPWYDGNLLSVMDSLHSRSDARNLYVLHTIGSHWYYNLHVPPQYQLFTPLTTNRIVTNNSSEEVINSYDNTAVYMDVILDSIIERVQDKCAIILYLSDHGEALGEDGEWLHAGYAAPLHNPACIIWYSDTYCSTFPHKVHALQSNRLKRYRTDFFYYSVLSAVGVEPEGANVNLDVFFIE